VKVSKPVLVRLAELGLVKQVSAAVSKAPIPIDVSALSRVREVRGELEKA